MRRAGFEARVLPLESGSFEENPPTLLDFVQRDLRWCRGNLQYLFLPELPGLLPMSRFQLFWAVSMFIGAPAWTAIIALAPFSAALDAAPDFPATSLAALYLLFLGFYLAPKLVGFADAVGAQGGLHRYGGIVRFSLSALGEVAASFVIGAVTTFNVTLFFIGSLSGRKIDWGGQARDAYGLTWRAAARALWPHLLFGVVLYLLGAAFAPRLLLWSLPVTIGYLTAIPFAVFTASRRLGRVLMRLSLFATPEEFARPEILSPVHAPQERERLFDARVGLMAE